MSDDTIRVAAAHFVQVWETESNRRSMFNQKIALVNSFVATMKALLAADMPYAKCAPAAANVKCDALECDELAVVLVVHEGSYCLKHSIELKRLGTRREKR